MKKYIIALLLLTGCGTENNYYYPAPTPSVTPSETPTEELEADQTQDTKVITLKYFGRCKLLSIANTNKENEYFIRVVCDKHNKEEK